MSKEDESIEGKEDDGDEADEGGQFPSHHHLADDVHHEKNEEERSYGSEEIGLKVVQPGSGDAVSCMDEDVGKDEGPAEEGNVPDAPERMEQALSRGELREKDEDETFRRIPHEPLPVIGSADAQIIIVLQDEAHQEKGTQKVEDDFSCRRLTPPVVELFLLLFPTKHLIPPRVRLYHFKYKFWPGLGQGENSIFPRQEIVKPGRPAKTWTIFGMGEFAFRAGFEAVRFKPEGYSGS